MFRRFVPPVLALCALLAAASSAEAVPAYARKHKLACSQCHSAWPLLNGFGRTFKENGYRLDRSRPAEDPDSRAAR